MSEETKTIFDDGAALVVCLHSDLRLINVLVILWHKVDRIFAIHQSILRKGHLRL